ncbi:MAG TPA: helix-turn-helix domain-containing protein [Candidatus Angelobacter sp.]|jgi:excisionase family DNA binding protein|nr:helix-turn-helix domain-containing protein [Candidatus Angelobacter sp.]
MTPSGSQRPIPAAGPTPAAGPADPRYLGDGLLLTVIEAAHQVRISRTEMWRRIGRGEVRVVKIGRLTRIRPEALRDFVLRLEAAS